MPEDDPTELFDLYDGGGRALGVSKPRALVHRDGDWHRSVHVWVVLTGEPVPSVVFQRRSLTKDSHPGKVDVSVAGHVRARPHVAGVARESASDDETVLAALRETEEEIGLVIAAGDLVRLGTRSRADDDPPRLDRELQEIFCVATSRGLATLRPDPDEVLALLAVALPDARALCEGAASVRAQEIRPGDEQVRDAVLRSEELLVSPDGYFAVALRSVALYLDGQPHDGWHLGGP